MAFTYTTILSTTELPQLLNVPLFRETHMSIVFLPVINLELFGTILIFLLNIVMAYVVHSSFIIQTIHTRPYTILTMVRSMN
jgi:hypothetical protein